MGGLRKHKRTFALFSQTLPVIPVLAHYRLRLKFLKLPIVGDRLINRAAEPDAKRADRGPKTRGRAFSRLAWSLYLEFFFFGEAGQAYSSANIIAIAVDASVYCGYLSTKRMNFRLSVRLRRAEAASALWIPHSLGAFRIARDAGGEAVDVNGNLVEREKGD